MLLPRVQAGSHGTTVEARDHCGPGHFPRLDKETILGDVLPPEAGPGSGGALGEERAGCGGRGSGVSLEPPGGVVSSSPWCLIAGWGPGCRGCLWMDIYRVWARTVEN